MHQGPFPPLALPGIPGTMGPSEICTGQLLPSRASCLPHRLADRHGTSADFPCCALILLRACHHHYPGRTAGGVSRSLAQPQRPSSLLWRVGFCIDIIEACTMFTLHYGPHAALLPLQEAFLEVLQAIRRLLARSKCFRPEREWPGGYLTHGTSAPLTRHTQRFHRTAVAEREVRGGLFAGVCQRYRGASFFGPLFRFLQSAPAA